MHNIPSPIDREVGRIREEAREGEYGSMIPSPFTSDPQCSAVFKFGGLLRLLNINLIKQDNPIL